MLAQEFFVTFKTQIRLYKFKYIFSTKTALTILIMLKIIDFGFLYDFV